MSNPRGELTVSVGDKNYTLWLGMSVLAKLQAKHGEAFFDALEPPEDEDEVWFPDLQLIIDIVTFALERSHGDEVTPWLVDDLLAEHQDLLPRLMAAAFPEASEKGEGKLKRTKAAS